MKPTTLFTLLGVILVFIALFSWGYIKKDAVAAPGTVTTNTSVTATGAFSAPETLYDFGKISMKDGNVTKDFIITNTTDTQATLRNLTTSCMCTTAYIVGADGEAKGPFGMPGHGGAVPPANETIPAGESRTIRVVYDPNAHGPAGVGQIDRTITLVDASNGTLTLEIKANVTP